MQITISSCCISMNFEKISTNLRSIFVRDKSHSCLIRNNRDTRDFKTFHATRADNTPVKNFAIGIPKPECITLEPLCMTPATLVIGQNSTGSQGPIKSQHPPCVKHRGTWTKIPAESPVEDLWNPRQLRGRIRRNLPPARPGSRDPGEDYERRLGVAVNASSPSVGPLIKLSGDVGTAAGRGRVLAPRKRSNLFHRSAANSTVSGYAREYPGLRNDRISRAPPLGSSGSGSGSLVFQRGEEETHTLSEPESRQFDRPTRVDPASSQRKLAQCLTYCAR